MDLAQVVAAVRRSALRLLIAALAAGVVAHVVVGQRPDRYEAQATVDVRQVLAEDTDVSNSERADRAVANELVVAEGAAVRRLASERPGGDLETLQDDLSAEQLPGTDTLTFTARANGAGGAAASAALATSYAAAYVSVTLEQQDAALARQADQLAEQQALLQQRLTDQLQNGLSDSEVALQGQLQGELTDLVEQEVELRRQASTVQDPEALVLPATPPSSPRGPAPLVWGLLAAAMTLVMGGVLVSLVPRTRQG